jgi:hypothetical protein
MKAFARVAPEAVAVCGVFAGISLVFSLFVFLT